MSRLIASSILALLVHMAAFAADYSDCQPQAFSGANEIAKLDANGKTIVSNTHARFLDMKLTDEMDRVKYQVLPYSSASFGGMRTAPESLTILKQDGRPSKMITIRTVGSSRNRITETRLDYDKASGDCKRQITVTWDDRNGKIENPRVTYDAELCSQIIKALNIGPRTTSLTAAKIDERRDELAKITTARQNYYDTLLFTMPLSRDSKAIGPKIGLGFANMVYEDGMVDPDKKAVVAKPESPETVNPVVTACWGDFTDNLQKRKAAIDPTTDMNSYGRFGPRSPTKKSDD